MKKLTRILALTLCCLLAAGLAACGETPAPTPDPDPDPGAAIGGNTQIPNPVRRSAGTPRSRTRESPMKMTSSPILSWPATSTGTA